MTALHKYAVGDVVVYLNDFGVCWGLKTITALDTRTYDLWGEDRTVPVYHYEGTDTPWYGVSERNLLEPDLDDLCIAGYMGPRYFQDKYGFIPTLDQLGGCG